MPVTLLYSESHIRNMEVVAKMVQSCPYCFVKMKLLNFKIEIINGYDEEKKRYTRNIFIVETYECPRCFSKYTFHTHVKTIYLGDEQ